MSPATLQESRPKLLQEYAELQNKPLSLDLTRGKPSASQLDLANAMLKLPGDDFEIGGVDVRNYGGIEGLPAMRELFGEILGVDASCVIVGGNSSLTMMHDAIARACMFAVAGAKTAWRDVAKRKFICPVPGYDRHFCISEHFGFELLPVAMTSAGPDMQQVESLVTDENVKGIWCVPKYSNPDGACYSDATVQCLASMKTAASDFRIMWDNAYAEHHLGEQRPKLANIAKYCAAYGNENRVLQFASTSKMAHPGAGVAAMASSAKNIADALKHLSAQTIGPDKINQLRALKLFGNLNGLRAHMKKHAEILKPKFDLALEILNRDLDGLGIAKWSEPQGGYFISLDVADGCAKRAIELAAAVGVKLTAAGATFPYAHDPNDKNIRIAPTFPSLDDLRAAMQVLTLCVRLAASEA